MAVGSAKRTAETRGRELPAGIDGVALSCPFSHQVTSLAGPHRGLRSDWLTPVPNGQSRGELQGRG